MTEEAELKAAIERILKSPSSKKLVMAGPGTGKTTLFKRILELAGGESNRHLVLTFINNLKDDLEAELSGLAKVYTLHSYCLGLLYRSPAFRTGLSANFRCCPGLAGLIKEDWDLIKKSDAPQFVREMRNLEDENHIPFYLKRGDYYDAIDFDDGVYRVYDGLKSGSVAPEEYDLILVDEYQDFNRLEASFIQVLGEKNPIVVAGDDDQALYSQLRDSNWDYIRSLRNSDEYEAFELPFCMRCPKVVVDAVNDIIYQANLQRRLKGRITKPYKYFPPTKGADSKKYPKIIVVETSVQRGSANYMGRYIANRIELIPSEEIKVAEEKGYPVALVIAAQPYRGQIISYLNKEGYAIDTSQKPPDKLDRGRGLSILKDDPESNLGWRILLSAVAVPNIAECIAQTADGRQRLIDVLEDEFRRRILADVALYEPHAEELDEKLCVSKAVSLPTVKVTSFEGAKGLSAQHVFIAGLHEYELPRNPEAIQDIEICKFIVGLTRTRKLCSLIYTRRFAGKRLSPSSFISWINGSRLERRKVKADYWRA